MTARTGNVSKNVRRLVAAAVFAVATVGMSACSGPPGSAEAPASDSGEASRSPTSETTSKPLAGVKPCEVFTSEQAAKLGLNGPGTINEFDDSTCDWEVKGAPFGVSVYKDMALNEIDFSEAKKQNTTLGGRQAVLAKENSGSGTCSLAFAMTNSSSVSVNSVADTTKAACDLVKKAAPMVEKTVSGK